MKTNHHSPDRVLRAVGSIAAIALLGLLLVACGGGGDKDTTATPAAATPTEAAATETPPAASSTPAVPQVLLTTIPETGPVGTSVTVTGDGLPPGETAELIWVTVDGSYDTKLENNRVEFYERKFTEKRVPLASTSIDTEGSVTFEFSAPEDYGELHDLYVAVDGQDAAKGGFRLMRSFTMSPEEGPVGTLVTIKVTALGSRAFESTAALLYDNKYTGFISATTTRGTAVAQIRAAGPIGKHPISVHGASHTLPYLNVQQSPVAHLVPFKAVFNVTEDAGAPEARVDWSDADRVVLDKDVPRTTVSGGVLAAPGASASLSPAVGPILTEATLRAAGLPPDSTADLMWVTVIGNDLFGWNLSKEKLGEVKIGQDGSVNTAVTIPEGLGGWHALTVEQNEEALVETPFFIERSLVGVTPAVVKAGETFTVQIKGVGWTELDNGVSVTYDNAYIGYACGFASYGDVTIELVATGGPGTHLIDLYPMIYDGGHGKWPWQYNMPQLTWAQDHPSLALGYRLPAFRLAIEVVE
ncbi:MAG: hypothetical protein Q7T33_05935 [Dehalococcoidia bacterium]|nr:hypothetical protein [Dehalococcoidia bacterium]